MGHDVDAEPGQDLESEVAASFCPLVGAVLAEQHDAWAEQRRYIGLDVLTRCRTALTTPTEPAEVSTTLVPALTA